MHVAYPGRILASRSQMYLVFMAYANKLKLSDLLNSQPNSFLPTSFSRTILPSLRLGFRIDSDQIKRVVYPTKQTTFTRKLLKKPPELFRSIDFP